MELYDFKIRVSQLLLLVSCALLTKSALHLLVMLSASQFFILYHQPQVAALFLVSLFAIFNYAPVFYLPRGSMLFYPTEPEEVHQNEFPRIDVETTFYRQPQLL